jgi:hypothetical protein
MNLVDETSAGVMGKEGYVWVLTSLEEVAYFYTPTRSGDTIQAMLRDFSGVLVTDFYAVYDAIQCPQQKCVIHFIRDLNEELLSHPYDDELKQLVGAFADLVKPMIETVDLRGLKKRFLGKHRIFVDRFYKRLSDEFGASETARKTTECLQKNRNTMFPFLDSMTSRGTIIMRNTQSRRSPHFAVSSREQLRRRVFGSFWFC